MSDKVLRLLTVIGTRPEAIKMAPVVFELRRRPGIDSRVCLTAQHRQMADQVLDLFAIEPDYDLDLMQSGQQLAQLTARLLAGLDPLLAELEPDWVLAQGDTTTVMAAALAAFYRGIAFGHVEAGLRTGDLRQPFPEELNRQLADLTAAALFAPTEHSREVLLAHGTPADKILVTGNTVVDALQHVATLPYSWNDGPLAAVPPGRLVLVTCHRRESFGQPLVDICRALSQLAATFAADGVHFVLPVHPNPQVAGPVRARLSRHANFHLLEPLDYRSQVELMRRAELVLTDSGGIQEEAPSLSVPVLVLRHKTERPEGIAAGVARLIGTDTGTIIGEASRLLRDAEARRSMSSATNPYGDGQAARRIVDHLLSVAR